MKLRKNRRKVEKIEIYKFMVDSENKNLIQTFLAFLGMIFIFAVVPNFWLKLLVYYIYYFLVIKKYDQVVDYLFRKTLRQASKWVVLEDRI